MTVYGAGVYGAGVYGGSPATTAPIVIPLNDWSPIPRMAVTFNVLHPDAVRITAYRNSGGRNRRVRSQIRVFSVGGVGFLDFEAPGGVPSSYRAEQFDSTGVSLGFTESASASLDAVPFGYAIIHQPLNPSKAVLFELDRGAAGELVKPSRGELFYPEGRREPVWVGSGRRPLAGIPLPGWTTTLEAAGTLDSVFGSFDVPESPIICVRTTNLDLPPTVFVLVEEPIRRPFDRDTGGETIFWDLSGDEVAPPAEGLIVPLLTYDDLDAAYATYDVRDAAYATYLEQDTDWSLVGVTG